MLVCGFYILSQVMKMIVQRISLVFLLIFKNLTNIYLRRLFYGMFLTSFYQMMFILDLMGGFVVRDFSTMVCVKMPAGWRYIYMSICFYD